MAISSVETSIPERERSSEVDGLSTSKLVRPAWERELAGWLALIVGLGVIVAALSVLGIVHTDRIGELLVFDLVAVASASVLAHISCRPSCG